MFSYYNSVPTFADTFYITIIVEDEISFIIPNVFKSNGYSNNDNFVIQIRGASLIAALNVQIFNRWRILVESNQYSGDSFNKTQNTNNHQLIVWDHRATAASAYVYYFYVVTYTKYEEEVVTLLR